MTLRSFINRLRGKPKWVPPEGNGRCTEDWQAGDLAECIDDEPWFDLRTGSLSDGPKHGDLLRVSGISMVFGHVLLRFYGGPDRFSADSFRKITPRQDEACTDAFKRQMKGLRPKVDA